MDFTFDLPSSQFRRARLIQDEKGTPAQPDTSATSADFQNAATSAQKTQTKAQTLMKAIKDMNKGMCCAAGASLLTPKKAKTSFRRDKVSI